MVTITLPDGSIKQFETPPTGLDVARSISEGLARDCVAMEIDGNCRIFI
jgi:threonyl-tRNA synthetase